MCELHYFLGVKVIQEKTTGDMCLGQLAYAERILQKFGMEHVKTVSTPVNTSLKLIKAVEERDIVDQIQYQSSVGSLSYFSTRTRPDITYAVRCVARFCAKPTEQHWTAVKRIMRYLK